MQEAILVLSQSMTQADLIARTLRCQRIYAVVRPLDASLDSIPQLSVKGVVVAQREAEPPVLEKLDPALLPSGLPLLMLEGAALSLCAYYEGVPGAEEAPEGSVDLQWQEEALFEGLESEERRLLPFSPLALSQTLLPIAMAENKIIGFRHERLPHYGLQYPIERNDPDGARILANFARRICLCSTDWDDDFIIDRALEAIRAQVPGEGRALCAVSGGVDSAVCARLASLALGNRLTCILVDTGFFHRNEPQRIIAEFMETMGIVVAYVDAREAFLDALRGVNSQEEKESRASALMTQMMLRQFEFEPEIHTLILGTNYNDALYGYAPSVAFDQARGAFPLRVLEPVRHLFKDEVRRLAQSLSLPASFAGRQPFPTSGLAARIFGEVTEERLEVIRLADDCLREEILAGGFERKLWQYYTVLMQSPDRQDRYTIAIRALQAGQATATSARLPFDLLERVTERILREIHSISRVAYDLTPSSHYREME